MGEGEYNIAAALYFAWFANEAKKDVEVPTFDITGMDFVEFELYVSHPDYLVGIPVCFELTSGGTCDKEEDAFIKNADEWMKDKDGNYIKAGWNTIRVPLSLFPAAGADRTRINCFRMFNNAKVNVAEGETFVLTMKSFGFGTEAEGVTKSVPFDANIGVGGGTWLDYKASNKTTLPAGKVTAGQWMAQYATADFGTQDLSNFRFVDITMKITNVEEFKKIKWEIELCSGGGCDKEETNYTGFFDDVAEGWNTIRVPLSAFTRKNGGGADFSRINYMRMYSIGTEADRTLEKDVTIELTKFVFSDGAATNWKEYSFTASKTAELPEGVSLISEKNFGENDSCVFADAKTEIVYKLDLEKIEPSAAYITLTTGGAELLLQVAEKNKADSYKTVFDTEDNMPRGTYVINVADYVAMNKFASSGMALYLRVADTNTDNGNGGQIRKETPVNFMIAYSDWETDPDKHYASAEDIAADEAEMTVTEHSVPLFGCNAALAGYKIDYNDKMAGSSSIAYTVGEWTETDKETGEQTDVKQVGTVMQFTTDAYAGVDYVDATGMDTLEFWFWVSDKDALAAAAFADTGLELTSSGTCDDEETNWRLIEHILPQVTENETWTAIRLPFSTGGKNGETDWSRLNYCRLFFVNASNLPETPVTIKIDDIRLTDYEAQQIAKETPVAEEFAAKVTEKLGNIPEWDDENADVIAQYTANAETWKADYETLKAELDALSDTAQSIVTDLGAKKLITNLKRWLDRFDKYEPPVEGGEDQPPVEGGEDQPPVEGGEDQPPVEGGEDQPPVDGGDEQPKEGGNTVIIIVIVAVVVVAAAVVAFIVIKKKKA
jgi:hypothetical protein